MSKSDFLNNIIAALPDKPGVYQYYDKNGELIYVGKAKSLKKRVSSYFTKQKHESAKTTFLVKKIVDIKYLTVESELEALLTENSLIKEHQPKYNIQLKDDKTYPWICIKNEMFPRVFKTRNPVQDGSEYYGPYSSVKTMQGILNLVKQLYNIRTCSYNFTKESIEKGKYKVCLEYHIGNCLGPCEKLQSEEEYNIGVDEVRGIIKGSFSAITKRLTQEMKDYAEQLKFEKAQEVKNKLSVIENFKARSVVFNPKIKDVDVFTIVDGKKEAYINFLKVMNGTIVQGQTVEVKKKLDEEPNEILERVIWEFRHRFNSEAKEIILPFDVELPFEGVEITIPQRGDKKAILDLSLRNAKVYRLEQQVQNDKKNPHERTERILKTLQKDLRLKEMPEHIECFDNSNFQGTNAVAACVVFKNSKPSKKDYRHFNIKTVEGPDDFASMEEVVFRRYSGLLKEKAPLPQLIIIDGGKGQLGAALKSLEKLDLRGKIGIVGIAKKLEEIYFPGDSIPAYIDKRSESLKLIQHLRNEAHRFGITHHRNKRSQNFITSELTQIEGIGEKTIKQLLNKFKSVKRIKVASQEELAQVAGKDKGEKVFKFFNET